MLIFANFLYSKDFQLETWIWPELECKKLEDIVIVFISCFDFVHLLVFENKEKIILVMEYASGGELYDYINEKQGLDEDEARRYFRQIVSAVHYLHQVSGFRLL